MNRTKILVFGVFLLIVLGCFDSARADVALTVAPLSLTFNNVPSNSVSPIQQVQVSANQTTTVIVQVSQTSPWLVVSPTTLNVGTTPISLNVHVNAQGLIAGTYSGSFTISVSAAIQTSLPSQTVVVTPFVVATTVLSCAGAWAYTSSEFVSNAPTS